MTQYDRLLMDMEREVEELKAARSRASSATSTIAHEVTCQSKSTMVSGYIFPDTEAIITITPDNAGANDFIFTISQPGVQGDGTSSFVEGEEIGPNGYDYIVGISTLSYNGQWNDGEQKTITHHVRIIATSDFEVSVDEREA